MQGCIEGAKVLFVSSICEVLGGVGRGCARTPRHWAKSSAPWRQRIGTS